MGLKQRLSKYERASTPAPQTARSVAHEIVAICRDRDCRTPVNSLPGTYVTDIERLALKIIKLKEA